MLHPGYLLCSREGMVEARDVGHDGLFIWTSCAYNICGKEMRSGGTNSQEPVKLGK